MTETRAVLPAHESLSGINCQPTTRIPHFCGGLNQKFGLHKLSSIDRPGQQTLPCRACTPVNNGKIWCDRGKHNLTRIDNPITVGHDRFESPRHVVDNSYNAWRFLKRSFDPINHMFEDGALKWVKIFFLSNEAESARRLESKGTRGSAVCSFCKRGVP